MAQLSEVHEALEFLARRLDILYRSGMDRDVGMAGGARALTLPSTSAEDRGEARDAGISLGEPRWRSLLTSIRTVQMELKRSSPERQIGLAGNAAAPESALLVTELRLGRRLPPSYREFLAFSDGWPRFFEGASLLGTGDIGRRSAGSANQHWRARGRLLPFGADRAGTSLFAFDTSVRLCDGELPVVAWVGGLGIDCRCFTSFLATVLQLCRAELATVKGRGLLTSPPGESGLPSRPGSRGDSGATEQLASQVARQVARHKWLEVG